MPTSLASSARKFQNLEGSDFEMTHSSKKALMFAASLGAREILAIGYPSILREAIIRGATKFKAAPLCDDPVQQISFFPEDDAVDHIVTGENLEWVFTGASLAGAIAQRRHKQLVVCDGRRTPDLSTGSVLLVTDSGESQGGIDIRRIKNAAEASVDPEGVLGNATFLKQESAKGEIINGDPSEVGTAIARKLRRLTRTTNI